MARNRKRQPQHPAQEGMRRTLDQLEKLSNSLVFRELRERPPKSNPELEERIRRISESPSIKRLREQLLVLLGKPDEPAPPSKKRKRAPGAGRPPTLTEEEIERGIKLLFSAKVMLSEVPISPKRACGLLREAGIGVSVSDLTLRRRIINAARDRLRGKLVS
ncbi:hypothetical protein [Bradyrhizobium erythrophlei]|uniref:Uncharacterized protein n=1 Tax=Bradyrhizobium erythrophlei TaxID=1437360 RepID=A0A1M5YIN0_9BRAD|nr:hypothetical protein [Bradyrhizobium erythrophlei]SHI11865.1 hypothetical protein SAMN05443248_8369 [Bradyrhizobium erythrophlei]